MSFLVVFAAEINFSFAQNKNSKSVKQFTAHRASDINLKSFKPAQVKKVTQKWLDANPKEFHADPEFGVSTIKGHPGAVEFLDRRTINHQEYLTEDGTLAVTEANIALHYADKNGWLRTIDYDLQPNPIKSSVYTAPNQTYPKSIDAKTGLTTMSFHDGDFSFNAESRLSFQAKNGSCANKGKISFNKYSVGSNGLYAAEVWENIDREVIFLKSGDIKTNYILHTAPASSNCDGFMMIEENIVLPQGYTLVYDRNNGSFDNINNFWLGDISIIDRSNKEVAWFNQPQIGDANYIADLNKSVPMQYAQQGTNYDIARQEGSGILGAYRLEKTQTGYLLTTLVPVEWLLNNQRTYPIIIDPLITVGPATNAALNTLCAPYRSWPSSDQKTVFGSSGCVSVNLTIPAGAMVLPDKNNVDVASGYEVKGGCQMDDMFMTYYGPCGNDPVATDYFWFCNTNYTGSCGGNTVQPQALISPCTTTLDAEVCAARTAPACTNTTVTIEVCLQRRCGSTANSCLATSTTGTSTHRGWGTFKASIYARTIEMASSTAKVKVGAGAYATSVTTCPGTCAANFGLTFTATGAYGVPCSQVASNCTNTLGGTYALRVVAPGGSTIYDGAVGTGTTSTCFPTDGTNAAIVSGTYSLYIKDCCGNLSTAGTVTVTIGGSIAPIVPDVTVCTGQSATATVSNPQGGYVYSWYNTVGGAVQTTGTSWVIGTNGGVAGTVTKYVRATTPCNSTYDTVVITWTAAAVPTATGASTCPGKTATLSAVCSGTCEWMSSNCAGLLTTGPTYTTPVLASTTTYYVRNNLGACQSACVAVTATVVPLTVSATPDTSTCCRASGCTSATFTGTFTGVKAIAGDVTYTDGSPSGTQTPDACAVNALDCGAIDSINIPVVKTIDASTIRSVCVDIGCLAGIDANIFLMSPTGTTLLLTGQQSKNKTAEAFSSTQTCWHVDSPTTLPNKNQLYPLTYAKSALGTTFVGENLSGQWYLYAQDINSATSGGSQSICDAGGVMRINTWSLTIRDSVRATQQWTAVGSAPIGSLSSTTNLTTVFTSPASGVVYSYNYALTVTDATGCIGYDTVTVRCCGTQPTVVAGGYVPTSTPNTTWDITLSAPVRCSTISNPADFILSSPAGCILGAATPPAGYSITAIAPATGSCAADASFGGVDTTRIITITLNAAPPAGYTSCWTATPRTLAAGQTIMDLCNRPLLNTLSAILLPVEYLYFNGKMNGNAVELNWGTASERESDYFTVERSKSGRIFETIGKVKASGNSTTEVRYQFIDKSPLKGLNYYRLKDTDLGGEVRIYDNIIFVTNGSEYVFKITNIKPIPANDFIEVDYLSDEAAEVKLLIYDLLGAKVREMNVSALFGENKQSIDLTSLNSGAYYIILEKNKERLFEKIIKY